MAHCPDCNHPIKTSTVIKITISKMSTTCEQCKKPLWIYENKLSRATILTTCMTILLFSFAVILKPTHFAISMLLLFGGIGAFAVTIWRYYYDTVFETKK
jgi:hypothetical protein